jgi:type IV pilus assembly protein PilB
MVTLRHDGFRKVREGLTSVEEVLHVAGDCAEFVSTPETAAPAPMPVSGWAAAPGSASSPGSSPQEA